jgi:hypothetical protein
MAGFKGCSYCLGPWSKDPRIASPRQRPLRENVERIFDADTTKLNPP